MRRVRVVVGTGAGRLDAWSRTGSISVQRQQLGAVTAAALVHPLFPLTASVFPRCLPACLPACLPTCSKGESHVTLLNFVSGQSNAAAQGTAIALGTYHTVALLCNSSTQGDAQQTAAAAAAPASAAAPHHVPEYSMYSMGRGFHGQLGLDLFENQAVPARVSAVFGGVVVAVVGG